MLNLVEIPPANFQGMLYDHLNLFAQENSTLSEEGLCPFLQEMDQEEYQVVVREHNQINEIEPIQKGAKVVGGALAGGTFGAALEVGLLAAGLMGLGAFVVATALTSSMMTKPNEGVHRINRLLTQISNNRISRLDQKIQRIASQLQITQPETPEGNQLQIAKNYFEDRKREIEQRITVTINNPNPNQKKRVGFFECVVKSCFFKC